MHGPALAKRSEQVPATNSRTRRAERSATRSLSHTPSIRARINRQARHSRNGLSVLQEERFKENRTQNT
eukprot:1818077-Rhodomonas_salina.1